MTEPTTSSDGAVSADAAIIYHERLVPPLFAPFPPLLADRASIGTGDHVLDVGCGSGIAAIEAAGRVGPTGRVVGLDPNPAMLAVARRQSDTVEWHEGKVEALPFADASFDVVLCQFALMFFADPARGIAEMRRVLRPDGRIVVATWAGLDRSPPFADTVELLRTHVGEAAAAELEAPYCIGTSDRLAALLRPLFPAVGIEEVDSTADFASVQDFVEVNIDGWTMDAMLTPDQRSALHAAAAEVLVPWVDGGGRLRFPAPALIATA